MHRRFANEMRLVSLSLLLFLLWRRMRLWHIVGPFARRTLVVVISMHQHDQLHILPLSIQTSTLSYSMYVFFNSMYTQTRHHSMLAFLFTSLCLFVCIRTPLDHLSHLSSIASSHEHSRLLSMKDWFFKIELIEIVINKTKADNSFMRIHTCRRALSRCLRILSKSIYYTIYCQY